MFPEERYLQKSKKLGEIIKLFNMPPFTPKKKSEKNDNTRVSVKEATRKIGGVQKKIDIRSSKVTPLEEFYGMIIMKPRYWCS